MAESLPRVKKINNIIKNTLLWNVKLGSNKINNIIKGPYDQKLNICQNPKVERIAGVKNN